jgi:hypothetical protein
LCWQGSFLAVVEPFPIEPFPTEPFSTDISDCSDETQIPYEN